MTRRHESERVSRSSPRNWGWLVIAVSVAAAHADTLHVPTQFPKIQSAINAAVDGDDVLVAPGTYVEAINFFGKAITLHSSGGADVTTIDGTGNFHVVQCVSGEGSDSVLDGFVITGGNADGDKFPDDAGGGMLNDGSSPTVTNCSFIGNTAGVSAGHRGQGGGMYNRGGSPTVTSCSFSENTVHSYPSRGGGMHNDASNPTVTSCSFIGNQTAGGSAGGSGGGISNYNSNSTITNCLFIGNVADGSGRGGGLYNDASSPTVTNCLFVENMGGYGGGGMGNRNASSPTVTNCSFIGNRAVGVGKRPSGNGGGMNNLTDSNPTVTNCSFIGNRATWSGGRGSAGGGMGNNASSPMVTNCSFVGNLGRWDGMSNRSDASPTVTNCIFRDGGEGEIQGGDFVTITYSNIQGGWKGEGNIDADPMFVDPDNDDFRLAAGSACIDAGDNFALPDEVTTDLDGNPRFVDDPDTQDTGNGDAPIVDMGAYEFQVVCAADMDGDGDADADDFFAYLNLFESGDDRADIDGDGDIDAEDFFGYLDLFAQGC